MYHIIIEQTNRYPKRMEYNPLTNSFSETSYKSLAYVRKFIYPYGWIKESGTPPEPHYDVYLMSEAEYELGDEVEIKIIGLFKRKDGDYKYIAVCIERGIDDISRLSELELSALHRLYPVIGDNEGWFGKDEADKCLFACPKAL